MRTPFAAPEPYTGRPSRPIQLEQVSEKLVSVRLESDGFIQMMANRLLGDWTGLESCLNRLGRAVSFPEDAPRKNGKRHATRGRVFDLAVIYDRLNRRYFENLLSVSITWGRETQTDGKRKRSVQFGSYCFDDREIRVHPILDSPRIPLYYAEFIVYHEMCHAHVGVEMDESDRPRYHGPRFKAREKQYDHFDLALRWEKENTALFFERPVG